MGRFHGVGCGEGIMSKQQVIERIHVDSCDLGWVRNTLSNKGKQILSTLSLPLFSLPFPFPSSLSPITSFPPLSLSLLPSSLYPIPSFLSSLSLYPIPSTLFSLPYSFFPLSSLHFLLSLLSSFKINHKILIR